MTLTDALGSNVGPNFDDEISAADFKLALIERYCRGEIPAHTVQMIFEEIPALKVA